MIVRDQRTRTLPRLQQQQVLGHIMHSHHSTTVRGTRITKQRGADGDIDESPVRPGQRVVGCLNLLVVPERQ